ncbi:MAG: hypothetical protein ACYS8W_14850 [Planctomycetota bacterium]
MYPRRGKSLPNRREARRAYGRASRPRPNRKRGKKRRKPVG